MGAGEEHRRTEARRQISRGAGRECRPAEERDEVPCHLSVLIDQHADDPSLALQEAEDLAGGHRGPPPEDAHARALADLHQEGRDPRVVRFLGDRAAGNAGGRHAAPEQLPGADVRGHDHDALSFRMGGMQQRFVARVEIDERADVHPIRARGLQGGPPEIDEAGPPDAVALGFALLRKSQPQLLPGEPPLAGHQVPGEPTQRGPGRWREDPQEGYGDQEQPDAQLPPDPLARAGEEALLSRLGAHPRGAGLAASSGGGQPTFASSRSSQSSRTAPRPAGRRETQRTSSSTSGAASRGAQESATLRRAGRSLTSSPMNAVWSSGTPSSAAMLSIASPLARLPPTT